MLRGGLWSDRASIRQIRPTLVLLCLQRSSTQVKALERCGKGSVSKNALATSVGADLPWLQLAWRRSEPSTDALLQSFQIAKICIVTIWLLEMPRLCGFTNNKVCCASCSTDRCLLADTIYAARPSDLFR